MTKKKPPKSKALVRHHADSVMDCEDPKVTVMPAEDDDADDDESEGRNSLSRQDDDEDAPRQELAEYTGEVRKAARDLVLQAKEAMSRKGGHFPAHVTLELEDDTEIDAAMMLEHQGRGRLFKDGQAWCFEFNEEGMMGGILKGDVLQSKD